ncbi:MAG: cyclic nucleotide-binding domain-containing protein [Betaproteobacteria bacterium]|jgi:CRP-like cAMP-binding protein
MAESNDALMLRLASHVSLFTGMPRSALVRLIARAERATKAPGGMFFDEGEMGASFYVLVMGLVVVEKRSRGHWVELSRLKPGDTFGEMSLLDEKFRSARVRALEPSVCLWFKEQGLADSPDVQAVIFKNMARMLAKRLKVTSAEVADIKAEKMTASPEAASPAQKTVEEVSGLMSRGDERAHLKTT